ALHVGDPVDEAKHKWSASMASEPVTLDSRFEWGVDYDRFNMKEVYPSSSDVGRALRGESEMTLQIDPKNFGVVLRRKLDQSYVDQRAEVFVDDQKVGVWYFAGSNTAVFGWTPGTTELV